VADAETAQKTESGSVAGIARSLNVSITPKPLKLFCRNERYPVWKRRAQQFLKNSVIVNAALPKITSPNIGPSVK